MVTVTQPDAMPADNIPMNENTGSGAPGISAGALWIGALMLASGSISRTRSRAMLPGMSSGTSDQVSSTACRQPRCGVDSTRCPRNIFLIVTCSISQRRSNTRDE